MKMALLYATREGHTRKIVEHIARTLCGKGVSADVFDVRSSAEVLRLEGYGGALLAASVHVGKHEKEMVAFVKRHRSALERLPCAFLSVSGSEATAEMAGVAADVRARAAADARRLIEDFFRATGFQPARFQSVAGAMLYTQYNFVVRFVIRWIAKRNGVALDTTSDHEYTDWTALDGFVSSFLQDVQRAEDDREVPSSSPAIAGAAR